MTQSWMLWLIFIAFVVYVALFFVVNIMYPKWRKRKYILPAIICLIGALWLSIGAIILIDMLFIIIGSLLLLIAIVGSVVGLIVDVLTRQRKVTYR